VRPTIVDALGRRRSREAVRVLLPLAESGDAATRQAALAALANMGDPAAAPALSRVRLDAPYRERAQAASNYLLYARRLAEAGHHTEALAAARAVRAGYVRPDEAQHASAALALIVSVQGARALPDLLAAMDHPVASVRGAALNLADGIPGREGTALWVEKARAAKPEVRAPMVAMLGRRGDAAALPFVRESLGSPDEAVRVAAIGAAARLGGEAALPELLGLLAKAGAAESAALKVALVGYPAALVVPQALSLVDTTPMPAKGALVEVLGEKGSHEAIEPVYRLASDEDPAVREAALVALARLARDTDVPRLVAMLEKTTATDEAVRLREAIAAAVLRDPDPEHRAEGLADLLRRSPPAGKAVILRLLPRVGGAGLLRAAAEEAASAEPDVQAAAISALSRWPDYAAGSELLRIAGALPRPEQGRLVASGYARLVARAEDAPPQAKVAALEKVLALPPDRVDRRAWLAAVASVREPEALRLLGRGLDDGAMREAAARALVDFAARQLPEEGWLSGHEAYSLLRRAEAALADPAARERAAAVIAERLRQGGFVPLFDGRSLDGWKGLVADPPRRAKMTREELARAQAEADASMREHWRAADGALVFDGKGESLCTRGDYGDFELLVDWKIEKGGDSGLYLRGSPQVQIWDAEANAVGSGGLFNNQKGPAVPSERADRPVGEWNSFRIFMIGERATVYLNDRRVVDNVVLENYWDRTLSIEPTGQIELQAHGNPLAFRNLYVREIPRDTTVATMPATETAEGFVPLFNGRDLSGWTGNVEGYAAENGRIVVHPERSGGNLYTAREYADFVLRFEFKLTPAANNGLGVRAPLEGDAAYAGMELQILEDGSPVYWELQPYQYHGSVYGVVPARRGMLRPVGEWNEEEVTVKGRHVTVVVNGTTIVDADLDEASRGGTMDHKDHPGLRRSSGHVGFLGHGSIVEFRNLRIRELK
jgi:HEAT repeat protein